MSLTRLTLIWEKGDLNQQTVTFSDQSRSSVGVALLEGGYSKPPPGIHFLTDQIAVSKPHEPAYLLQHTSGNLLKLRIAVAQKSSAELGEADTASLHSSLQRRNTDIALAKQTSRGHRFTGRLLEETVPQLATFTFFSYAFIKLSPPERTQNTRHPTWELNQPNLKLRSQIQNCYTMLLWRCSVELSLPSDGTWVGCPWRPLLPSSGILWSGETL